MRNSEKIGILESALAHGDVSFPTRRHSAPRKKKEVEHMQSEAVGFLDKLDGSGILITFAVFVAVGFAAAYIDMYVISKVESMAGVAPTSY
jgi:hypothetical protein